MTDAERTEAAASATPPPTPPTDGAAAAREPRPPRSEDSRLLAIARLLSAGRRMTWLRRTGAPP